MKIGLVGFAGSGKTTVFNTMTGLQVPVGIGPGQTGHHVPPHLEPRVLGPPQGLAALAIRVT